MILTDTHIWNGWGRLKVCFHVSKIISLILDPMQCFHKPKKKKGGKKWWPCFTYSSHRRSETLRQLAQWAEILLKAHELWWRGLLNACRAAGARWALPRRSGPLLLQTPDISPHNQQQITQQQLNNLGWNENNSAEIFNNKRFPFVQKLAFASFTSYMSNSSHILFNKLNYKKSFSATLLKHS